MDDQLPGSLPAQAYYVTASKRLGSGESPERGQSDPDRMTSCYRLGTFQFELESAAVRTMSDNTEANDVRAHRALWIVLLLNAAIALGFFVTGAIGDSSGLIANGLDNTSDTVVYAISLFALSRADKWKRVAANVSGGMLLLFAVGVLIDAVRRYFAGSEPLGGMMIAMSLIAALVNLVCVWLLGRIEDPDVNVRAANTFSWNDFAANGGILVAGAMVWWLNANWPDLVVGIAIAGVFIWGGVKILRDAHREHHEAVHGDDTR